MANFLKSRTAYKIFTPVRLLYRFLVNPWLWVLLAFLLTGTGLVTLFWYNSSRGWPERQAKSEFIGAVLTLFIAFNLKFITPFTRKHWRKIWRPLLAIILLLVLAYISMRIYADQVNEKLAIELKNEYETWLENLPTVPEEENRMPDLIKALEPLNEIYESEIYSLDSEVNNPTNMPILKGAFEKNDSQFQQVEEALRYKYFQYKKDYLHISWNHLRPFYLFSESSNCFKLRAKVAFKESRICDAIKDCIICLKIGNSLNREPDYSFQQRKIGFLFSGTSVLLEILSEKPQCNQKELENLLSFLNEIHNKNDNFSNLLEYEYYSTIFAFRKLIIGEHVHYPMFLFPEAGFRKIIAIILKVYDFSDDVSKIKNIYNEAGKYTPHKYYELSQSTKTEWKNSFYYGYQYYFTYFAAYEASIRAAIVMTGIWLFEKENGRLPESLSELESTVKKEMLIDPFSGKEFIYKVLKGDFTLYSVGANGKDDNCFESLPIYKTNLGSYEYDEINDIVFHTCGDK